MTLIDTLEPTPTTKPKPRKRERDGGGERDKGKGGKKGAKGGKAKEKAKRAEPKHAAEPALESGKKGKTRERGKKKKGGKAKRAPRFTARTADKYELYQYAVQSPEADVEFLLKTFKKARKRSPQHLREDFCGTGFLMCEWVSQGPNFTAEGFDLDPEPIAWGKANNWPKIGAAAERITMHLADARSDSERKADVVVAQNFSYSLFKERVQLLEYLRRAYDHLVDDGMFVLDVYGGPESIEPMEEKRKIEEGFTYVWDQIEHWPGTGEFKCAIHFRFKDKTELRNAFEYDWRVWTMPELKDLLHEAGFTKVESYFEGGDPDTGEGDGNFEKDERGEHCAAWIAYLVALK